MSTLFATGRAASPEKRIYYRLLTAQFLALISTGVATVALALLAYNLAGADAGAVLGTAFAIKMLAYVVITPLASAFAESLPRRTTLVILDLVRAAVALALPWVTRVGEVYLLIFIFQAASAMFTPVFQSAIPELLPDRRDYTRALSLSRLAHEIETVASPVLAAGLLLVVSFSGLFAGTVLGLIVSAAIILRVALPQAERVVRHGVWHRTVRGLKTFLATPRLRGLMALNLAAAAATAMVVINTVVVVQSGFGLSERATAIALAVYGMGSVTGALAISWMMRRNHDRIVMIGGAMMVAAVLVSAIPVGTYPGLLALWFGLGLGCAVAQTPAGTLVCRSSSEDDRQGLYAAQFALSHLCLLLTYPLAGWLGAEAGIPVTFLVMGLLAGGAALAATSLWPRSDGAVLTS